MKRVFKKYFVPHEHNEYKPHLLRTKKAVAFLGVFVVIEILFLIQIFIVFQSSGFLASILPGALVDGTNYARANTELNGLKINSLLEEAANLKAQDMATNGYFAHNDPEGRTPWYWLGRVGYRFNFAGENLAVNFHDSKDVIDAWLASEGHKANILNKNFTEIGIGTARGIYKDKEAVFIVQFFGKPYSSLAIVDDSTFVQKAVAVDVSLESPEESQKMFIEIASDNDENETQKEVNSLKIGEVDSESTFVGRLASTPRTIASYIYIALALIIALALVLKVFVHVKIQHPKLILNGLILIIVLASVLFLNDYLSLSQAQIF